ncbi:MAG: metallophosphoesterase family protein [Candidatus Omnitrophota bacterium]
MRYGILSDIHANLEAYEAVIGALKKEKINKIVIVGDLVGYGADPKACIKRTRFVTDMVVCGNHDRAAASLLDPEWFNRDAKEAVLWTAGLLDKAEQEFLKKISLICEDVNIIAVHGSLTDPQSFNYIFDAYQAGKTFLKMDNRPCFVGHSHYPLFFIKDKHGNIHTLTDKREIFLEQDNQYIINTGSVGQPRDGDNRASYVIYDVEHRHIVLKRTGYDIAKAQKKILTAQLPEHLAYRLSEGR